MKRYLLTSNNTKVVLIIIGSLMFASCSRSKSEVHDQYGDKGHLFIENPIYLFGKVDRMQHKQIICPFMLTNTGSKPIVIQKIDVSCGCISIKDYPRTIESNETKELHVVITTNRQYGFFNKAIYINTNADNPLELLRVKGEIY